MKKIILLSTILLAACGTIFNGSSQDVKFDSNVQGVDIYINGMKACRTPCVYPIDRKSSTVVVMAKKPGYSTQQTIIKSELSGIAILNLTFWPSWLTDVATGGMWKYSRDGIYVEMEGQQQRVNHYYDRYSQRKNNDSKIRRFALYNYGEIKSENPEYISTLETLTGKNNNELKQIISKSNTEVELAHNLTGIK